MNQKLDKFLLQSLSKVGIVKKVGHTKYFQKMSYIIQ